MLRLQQLTGPVMAKGLEDTVFYRYYPLASLNEVGGRPTGGGVEPDALPRLERRAASRTGRTACRPTATHDTKRGEDVRARLDVLSEIPREWQRVLRHWQRLNRRLKSVVDDVAHPERQRGVPHLPDADRRLADGRDRRRPRPTPRGSALRERIPST